MCNIVLSDFLFQKNSGIQMKSYEESITPTLTPQTALKRHTLKILVFQAVQKQCSHC